MDPSVSPVLHHLVNKHVITAEEERSLVTEKNPTLRGEIFVDLFAQKGFNAFRELCNCLEMDCPHLLTSLLLDSTGKTYQTHNLGINIQSIIKFSFVENYPNKKGEIYEFQMALDIYSYNFCSEQK